MTSHEECAFLHRLAKSVSEGVIVEIGSYQGRSSIALGKGSLDGAKADVFVVDPHEEFVGVLGGHFGPKDRQAFYEHIAAERLGTIIRLISLPSHEAAPAFRRRIGLLWIDGDHSFAGVTRDFENWSPYLTEKAVVAFDDSTDSTGGPYKLLEGLLKKGDWVEFKGCGKIRTFGKRQ
jgi:hypothetical protein